MTAHRSRDARIDGILEAALAEVVELGCDRASMEAIARRAGITKGGIYHHFSDKDALLAAVAERITAPLVDLLDECSRAPSACDGLRRYVTEYLDHWEAAPQEMAVVALIRARVLPTRAAGEHHLVAAQRLHVENTPGVLAEMYERGVASGELCTLDPGTLGMVLSAALDGVAQYVALDGIISVDDAASALLATFVDAWQAPRQRSRQAQRQAPDKRAGR